MQASRIPERIALASLALLFFSVAWTKVSNFDFFWHLKTGDLFRETGVVFKNDPFSYTRFGAPWFDFHLLFQWAVSAVHAVFGFAGLTAFKTLGYGAILLIAARRFPKTGLYGLVLLTALLCLSRRAMLRPEMASFLAVVLFVTLLGPPLTRRRCLVLAGIQVLWTNSHSLFLLGPVLVGFRLAAAFADPVRRKSGELRLLAFALALTGIAPVFSPWGIEGLAFPFRLVPKVIWGTNVYKGTIAEFASWNLLDRFNPYYLAWFLLVGGHCFGWLKKKRYFACLVALFTGMLALGARRNFNLFLFATMPLLAESDPLRSGWRALSKKSRVFIWSAVALAAAGYAFLFATDRVALHENSLTRFGTGMNRSMFSRKLPEFLERLPERARVFNTMSLGGYLVYFSPQTPVFYDGRLDVYGGDFHRRYLRMLYDTRTFEKKAAYYGINTAVLNHSINEAPRLMRLARTENWRLVYLDLFVAVLAKKGFADFLPALSGRALERRVDRLMEEIERFPVRERTLFRNTLAAALKDLGCFDAKIEQVMESARDRA